MYKHNSFSHLHVIHSPAEFLPPSKDKCAFPLILIHGKGFIKVCLPFLFCDGSYEVNNVVWDVNT